MAKAKTEPISWLPVPGAGDVPEDVATLWAKAERKIGHVPNVMRTFALRPDHLLKWFAHYDQLMRGESGLSKEQREMIGIVVSATNRCHYCIVSHSAALRVLTGDDVLADRLATNYRHAELDPKERAMLDFAHKVTAASHECSRDDLEELRRHGWTDEDIFDIAEVAAMFNFSNRMASAFGWVPNDLYHSWGRPPSEPLPG
jgi:uncharacterized peroxidase-related enzyme